MLNFDVIVVGGGHAGIEAAMASARVGANVALLLPNPEKIGLMPCNPAIGGPGKSQLVYELTALGGVMGKIADETAVHVRTLNASKGAAVQSLRTQNERDGYASAAQAVIAAEPNISIVQGEAAEMIVVAGRITGMLLSDGRTVHAPAIVLCTGTFLAGVVWYGQRSKPAGRQGEAPAKYLSDSLTKTGHALVRLQTSTPPRVRASTADMGELDTIHPDNPPGSFTGTPGPKATSLPTWLTRTTTETHRIIHDNLGESVMYSGDQFGPGPRYCPSIEDKIVRFADKDHHLLFVEPDGVDSSELYIQGFSSSLPPVVQDELIRTLPGFSRAIIQRYAYAVEYDAIDPGQLDVTLMSRRVDGLFSAGQINGTSGYEEAAAQGLIAGLNAARYAAGMDRVTVRRDQGYIGVMLDDLVRWGIEEPYRMLTSRNEYRLLHRQDNAMSRLLPIGYEWGLRDTTDLAELRNSEQRIGEEIARFQNTRIDGVTADRVICRPGETYATVVEYIGPAAGALNRSEKEQVEIALRYRAYIERSEKHLASRSKYENMALDGIDYESVASLSSEGREILEKIQPATIGAAQRLRGIRDSDLTALLVHVKTGKIPNVSRETTANNPVRDVKHAG